MKKKKNIHEGKTKKLYTVNDSEHLILEFKDDIVDSNDKTIKTIKGKGIINNQISAFIFDYLSGYHVLTHYIKTITKCEMLVRKLEIIPIKIVVHNIATGSLCKQYNVEDGKFLDLPILEYYLKDDSLDNPLMNASHAIAFKLAQKNELQMIDRQSIKINAILKSFFNRRNLKLVNLELEFGRYKDKIYVANEISLDTCRLWDIIDKDQFDKECFTVASDNLSKVYNNIKSRIL